MLQDVMSARLFIATALLLIKALDCNSNNLFFDKPLGAVSFESPSSWTNGHHSTSFNLPNKIPLMEKFKESEVSTIAVIFKQPLELISTKKAKDLPIKWQEDYKSATVNEPRLPDFSLKIDLTISMFLAQRRENDKKPAYYQVLTLPLIFNIYPDALTATVSSSMFDKISVSESCQSKKDDHVRFWNLHLHGPSLRAVLIPIPSLSQSAAVLLKPGTLVFEDGQTKKLKYSPESESCRLFINSTTKGLDTWLIAAATNVSLDFWRNSEYVKDVTIMAHGDPIDRVAEIYTKLGRNLNELNIAKAGRSHQTRQCLKMANGRRLDCRAVFVGKPENHPGKYQCRKGNVLEWWQCGRFEAAERYVFGKGNQIIAKYYQVRQVRASLTPVDGFIVDCFDHRVTSNKTFENDQLKNNNTFRWLWYSKSLGRYKFFPMTMLGRELHLEQINSTKIRMPGLEDVSAVPFREYLFTGYRCVSVESGRTIREFYYADVREIISRCSNNKSPSTTILVRPEEGNKTISRFSCYFRDVSLASVISNVWLTTSYRYAQNGSQINAEVMSTEPLVRAILTLSEEEGTNEKLFTIAIFFNSAVATINNERYHMSASERAFTSTVDAWLEVGVDKVKLKAASILVSFHVQNS